MSGLFRIELDLVAANALTVPFEQIVGQPLTVTLTSPSGSQRYFNGVVSRFAQGARTPPGTQYHAEVVPSLWFLTRTTDSRIFQQVTVPDILRQVLADSQVESSFGLGDTHYARNYCVQYRETDFDFVSRLMEDEGIFYFFQHGSDHHTLVVGDGAQAEPALGTFTFDPTGGSADRVFGWLKTQELRSGRVTLRDFEFELPGTPIEATATTPDSVRAGQVTHPLKLAGNDRFELFDYPGGWAQRFDGVGPGGQDQSDQLQNIFLAAPQTAGVRMDEEAEQSLVVTGGSTAVAFTPGNTFTLQGHFNGDGSYLLTQVRHTAQPLGAGGVDYSNAFTCIPVGVPFRPVRKTPKAVLHGTQTAAVVGPAGEEILTDKYGRVKVQFHWDRQGKNDENSSCWIRVGQPVGGKGHDFFWLPEIGDEVIVDFEEGDPDRPIIVGRVYNASDAPRRPPP